MISGIYILILLMSIHRDCMSDTYAIKRYHRQTVPVTGSSKKKKYLTVILLLLIAGMTGMAYLVYASGILAENNPAIAPQLAGRINLERQANDLPPVRIDSGLSNLAYKKSQEVKISQLNYAKGVNPNLDALTNVMIIPKITWAVSSDNLRQQMLESQADKESTFSSNVLNPDLRTLGIGVTSDSYNYYIVTKWKQG